MCWDEELLACTRSFRSWSQLACLAGETQELLNEWTTAETRLSKGDFSQFRLDWNRDFIRRVCIPAESCAPVQPAIELMKCPCADQRRAWCEWTPCNALQHYRA